MNNTELAVPAVMYSLLALVTFLMLLREIKGRGQYVRALIAMACTGTAAIIAWNFPCMDTGIDLINRHPLWPAAVPGCTVLALFPFFAWTEWYVNFWLKKRDLSSASQKEADGKPCIHYPSMIVSLAKWFYFAYSLFVTLLLLYLGLKVGRAL